MSTWEKGVVHDGIADDDWSTGFAGEPFAAHVGSNEDVTSFFITLEDGKSNVGT